MLLYDCFAADDWWLNLDCAHWFDPQNRQRRSSEHQSREATQLVKESRSNSRHEQIARVAYELWENNGRPVGSAEKDWLLAEQTLELQDPAKIAFGALSLEPREE
jgi:hypothetical protein